MYTNLLNQSQHQRFYEFTENFLHAAYITFQKKKKKEEEKEKKVANLEIAHKTCSVLVLVFLISSEVALTRLISWPRALGPERSLLNFGLWIYKVLYELWIWVLPGECAFWKLYEANDCLM